MYWRINTICPECVGHQRYNAPEHVFHHKCGGPLYVGDNSKTLCLKCSVSESILNWVGICAVCNPEETYEGFMEWRIISGHGMGIGDEVSRIGSMIQKTGLPWFQSFLENLDGE